MFTRKPQDEDKKLQDAIDTAYEELSNVACDSDEYAKILASITDLYSLKETPQRVSPDVLATVAANLAGIILIVGHERAHVVTSKAINFVMKLR